MAIPEQPRPNPLPQPRPNPVPIPVPPGARLIHARLGRGRRQGRGTATRGPEGPRRKIGEWLDQRLGARRSGSVP